MKVEVTMTEESIKEAQIIYLLNEGIIKKEWKVVNHYPTLGQITFDTECYEEEYVEEKTYRQAKD